MAEVVSIINEKDVNAADVVVVSAPYAASVSFGKGAEEGPGAILACLARQIELEHRDTGTCPVDKLRIAKASVPPQYIMPSPADGFASPEDMVTGVSTCLEVFLRNNQFPILLGGEHSVSIGAWGAMAKLWDPTKICIVQVDAHLDLRDTDADYADNPHGPLAHCCVMRRAAEKGFRIVSVGIRDYSGDEMTFAQKHRDQIKVFEWGRQGQWQPETPSVVEAVRNLHLPIYLTVDVDGIDPSQMPATGTPVQGGIGWYDFRTLLFGLFAQTPVIGADIVEVAPRPGDGLTERGAAQIAYDMMALHLFQRQGGLWPIKWPTK